MFSTKLADPFTSLNWHSVMELRTSHSSYRNKSKEKDLLQITSSKSYSYFVLLLYIEYSYWLSDCFYEWVFDYVSLRFWRVTIRGRFRDVKAKYFSLSLNSLLKPSPSNNNRNIQGLSSYMSENSNRHCWVYVQGHNTGQPKWDIGV